MLNKETIARLALPLDTRLIKRLPDNAGPGKADKPYLPGWEHTRTANEIFRWQWSDRVTGHGLAYCELVELPGRDGKPARQAWSVGYWATVEVTVGEVTHAGMGFCDAMGPSKGDACSMTYGGAVTEARKSALEQFGDRFGLGLKDANDPFGAGYSGEVGPTLGLVPPAAPPALPALPAPSDPPAASNTDRTPSPAPTTRTTPATTPSVAQIQPAPTTQPPVAPTEAQLRQQIGELLTAYWKRTNRVPPAAKAVGVTNPGTLAALPADQLADLRAGVEQDLAALSQAQAA